VLVAKIVAGLLFIFVAAIAAQLVLVGLMAIVAATRGTMAGVDTQWVWTTSGIVARSALVATIASAIGFALASVARNTTAAVIAGFIYFAVLESAVRGFRPNWTRWLLGDNAFLFVIGREEADFLQHSEARALATLLFYGVALFSLALATFRARDVT
jgi:hypothetical protein